MKTKLFGAGIVGFGMLAGALSTGIALAQPTDINDANIHYPVAELGNCQDKDACKTYCDDSAHLQACIAFAEKNNLMSQDDIDAAKKFLVAGAKGPGGCTSKESCETYCDDINHITECVSFAETTGILPPDRLAEAKDVQAAIAKGVQPPPCKNKKECDAYCEAPDNMKVCVSFGEAAGFLQGKELEDAKKVLSAIDKGAVPPPCRGKDACDSYCSAPEHMETCMKFAKEAGLMSPQEAEDSDKALAAVKKGAKPPACAGKDACDAYCAEPAHLDECANFAVAAGFMSEKDVEVARKTGGKGPGGCRSKDACDAFCGNPDNQQTCFNFARDNGLISPEDLQKMEEGQKQFQQSLQNMPPEVSTCLQNSIGSDAFEKFKSGQAMPSRDMGEKIGQCFSKMGGPPGQGQEPGSLEEGPMGMPPQGFRGSSTMMRPQGGFPGAGIQQMEAQWNAFPPEVRSCLTEKLGNDRLERIKKGQGTAEDQKEIPQTIQSCFQNMMQPAGMQPLAPPQNQETRPGQNSGWTQPQEGMPLNQFNQTMPFNGAMPPGGGTQQLQQGTQQMMQPGELQQEGTMPSESMPNPNTGAPAGPQGIMQMMPQASPPPTGTSPPQSYNVPTLGQFLLGIIGGILSR